MKMRLSLSTLVLCTTVAAHGGTVTLKSGNYIGNSTTQTFVLSTQVFTGSTSCGSGGGSIATIPGVDSISGHSLSVGASDSVLVTADPGTPFARSLQNGPFVGWQTSVANQSTITYLPGDGRQVCISGFDGAGAREYFAQFYAGIVTLDLCGNPRSTFAPGETMLIRVAGGITFMPEPHRLLIAGGSVNECTFLPSAPDFTTVHVTADPETFTFTLPDSDADILPSCTGSGTQHITGNWRVVVYDPSCGCNRNQVNFEVQNDAPPPASCTLTCPADIEVVNDPGECGANVSYAPPTDATCSVPSGSFFPTGTTTVTCTSTTGPLSCSFDVTVTDDEAPSIAATASPSKLWPPNHKMVDVTVSAAASDNCGSATCAITSVASSEPANGLGDGDTAPDFEIVDGSHVRLRAERAGGGPGRVYTIVVTCTDADGNAGTKYVTVTVTK